MPRPPYLANFITSVCLGAGGDFVSQRYCEGVSMKDFDWRRFAAFTTFNGFYLAFVSQWMYGLYFTHFPRRLLRSKFHGLWAALADNTFHSPCMYLPCYFASTGLMRGDSVADIKATFEEQYFQTAFGCVGFWLPAQAVNFCFVPQQYHVRFMNTLCFVWNIALSWATNLPTEPRPQALLLD